MNPSPTKAEAILNTLARLGVTKAHFVAAYPPDIAELLGRHPEAFASLSMVNPFSWNPANAANLGPNVHVIAGDVGPVLTGLRNTLAQFPEITFTNLPGASNAGWNDLAALYQEAVTKAITDFAGVRSAGLLASDPKSGSGQVGDVNYTTRGSGPPLVFLPLLLAPSQWDPVLPALSERFCTIQLRGPRLGFMDLLEGRFPSPGYELALRDLVCEMHIQSGENVLEVGCGGGVDTRWLARQLDTTNPITGLDLNSYLLSEAEALNQQENLAHRITLQRASATDLPFPDGSFDVTLSITMLEELDADLAIAEMVRVTKPGGRVGAIVRAVDLPPVVNAPLPAELKAKMERPLGGPVAPEGCADASLYKRFVDAGLTDCMFFPAHSTSSQTEPTAAATVARLLTDDERRAWALAASQAEAEGTLFFTQPLHCAVGTKR